MANKRSRELVIAVPVKKLRSWLARLNAEKVLQQADSQKSQRKT